MTTIEVFHRGALISGFSAKGHTGYAEEGEDIVCAAVSAITQTAAMGLKHYEPNTQSRWREGDDPVLEVVVPNPNHETQVILETMLLGLEDILSGVPQFVRILRSKNGGGTQ